MLTDPRSSYKPFDYPWAYEAFMMSEQMHWLWTEQPLFSDINDWKTKLTDGEKTFLTHIFRFFTQGDIDVSGAYVNNFLPVFKKPELRMMLSSFAAREAVHIAAYSHFIETLGMPEAIYNEFLEYEEMKAKHTFVECVSKEDSEDPSVRAKQIAIFSAFTEGMQLFSSFAMLLNFKRCNKMKGMGNIIEWSIADESLHCDSMIMLFRESIKESPEIWNDKLKHTIYEAAKTMVMLEDKFIDLAYGITEIEKLSKQDMHSYIRYIADRRLTAMGMKKIFGSRSNPLPWVDEMVSRTHTNFFENKSTEYAKGTLTGSWADVFPQ